MKPNSKFLPLIFAAAMLLANNFCFGQFSKDYIIKNPIPNINRDWADPVHVWQSGGSKIVSCHTYSDATSTVFSCLGNQGQLRYFRSGIVQKVTDFKIVGDMVYFLGWIYREEDTVSALCAFNLNRLYTTITPINYLILPSLHMRKLVAYNLGTYGRDHIAAIGGRVDGTDVVLECEYDFVNNTFTSHSRVMIQSGPYLEDIFETPNYVFIVGHTATSTQLGMTLNRCPKNHVNNPTNLSQCYFYPWQEENTFETEQLGVYAKDSDFLVVSQYHTENSHGIKLRRFDYSMNMNEIRDIPFSSEQSPNKIHPIGLVYMEKLDLLSIGLRYSLPDNFGEDNSLLQMPLYSAQDQSAYLYMDMQMPRFMGTLDKRYETSLVSFCAQAWYYRDCAMSDEYPECPTMHGKVYRKVNAVPYTIVNTRLSFYIGEMREDHIFVNNEEEKAKVICSHEVVLE